MEEQQPSRQVLGREQRLPGKAKGVTVTSHHQGGRPYTSWADASRGREAHVSEVQGHTAGTPVLQLLAPNSS